MTSTPDLLARLSLNFSSGAACSGAKTSPQGGHSALFDHQRLRLVITAETGCVALRTLNSFGTFDRLDDRAFGQRAVQVPQ
jgi:hypothetical protein